MSIVKIKATPFVRWIGGKRSFVSRLAPFIAQYLDNTGGRYFEPFVGGGAMALALGRERMVINDSIHDLMMAYVAVRDEPMELCEQLLDMAKWGTREENYYKVRDTEPGDQSVDVAARMIYLSSLSFNGLWRTNQSGEMNAAYGKKAGRITGELIDRIGEAHKALKGVDTFIGDFSTPLSRAGKGDLVYLDPPYHQTYTGYADKNFCEADQERLALYVYEAMDRGAAVLLHNSDTPMVRFWYEQLQMVVTEEARAVNRDGQGRGKTGCLLASSHPDLLTAFA